MKKLEIYKNNNKKGVTSNFLLPIPSNGSKSCSAGVSVDVSIMLNFTYYMSV